MKTVVQVSFIMDREKYGKLKQYCFEDEISVAKKMRELVNLYMTSKEAQKASNR